MSEPVTIARANMLRSEAESARSAKRAAILFRQAAAEFKKLNMIYAADRCDEKAEHYEKIGGEA